jgi:hypothetical protein
MCTYLNGQRACLIKDEEVVEHSQYSGSWKIIFELMIVGNITCKVGAIIDVILSKAEKQ